MARNTQYAHRAQLCVNSKPGDMLHTENKMKMQTKKWKWTTTNGSKNEKNSKENER